MFFDFEPMSDADYAALPPLVKKGGDREEVIETIVTKWCKASSVQGSDRAAVEAHVKAGGFFLDGVALTDENTGEPIDFGELLKRVEERLRKSGEPEAFRAHPALFILLRKCRVDQCNCSNFNIRPRFMVYETKFGDGAAFEHARFGGGTRFIHARFGDEARFRRATFDRAVRFEKCTFGDRADFREVSFNKGVHFEKVKFGDRADFRGATLADADFTEANVSRAIFHLADVSGMKVSGTKLVGARGLFGKDRAIARTKPIDEHEAQNAIYAHWWDCISWEWLRYIGALRLFPVSYLTIIFIVLYATLARWYNPLAAHARQSARELIDASSSAETVSFWVTVLARLPDLPVPGHLGRQLIAIILLALAATIYALRCPPEVKEATEVRWTRAMNQPLWEYRSANWSGIIARYTCAILFAAGGVYTASYLLWRTWIAATYLLGW